MTTRVPSSDWNCGLFRRRFSTADDESAADAEPESDMDVGLIAIGMSWAPSAQPLTADRTVDFGQECQYGFIAVKRVMVCGLPGASRERLPLADATPEQCGEDEAVTDRLVDAFDDYAAKKLVGPVWKRSSEVWVAPVYENVAAVTETVEGVHDQWHDLLLGKPVQYLGGPPFLSDIAIELPLPGDTLFSGVRRILEFSGILFGLATGQPLLVNACFKLLTHDVLVRTVSKGIGELLSNTLGLERVGACQRDFERAGPHREISKQTTLVRGDFGLDAEYVAHDGLEQENLTTRFGFGSGRVEYGDRSAENISGDRDEPNEFEGPREV